MTFPWFAMTWPNISRSVFSYGQNRLQWRQQWSQAALSSGYFHSGEAHDPTQFKWRKCLSLYSRYQISTSDDILYFRRHATKWVKISHWNVAGFFAEGKLWTWSFWIKNKEGVNVFVFIFVFQQTGRNEHCLITGVNGQQQNAELNIVFSWVLAEMFYFFDFSLKYGQRNNCGEKKWDHQIGFKVIPLLCLKIVLPDTGYIEVQYTKIKSEQIECTCHSPKPRYAAPRLHAWGGRRTPVRSCGFESSLDTIATREPP